MKPTRTVAPGWMLPQPAVIETRPPRIPPHTDVTDHAFGSITKRRISIAAMPPAAGASVVFTATSPAEPAHAKPSMYKVLPQLKPYHPNQRMKVPRGVRDVVRCVGSVRIHAVSVES